MCKIQDLNSWKMMVTDEKHFTAVPPAHKDSTKNFKSTLTTIHPMRRKMTTLSILIRQDVKTPSHVPNKTGCEMKKLAFHHGTCCSICKSACSDMHFRKQYKGVLPNQYIYAATKWFNFIKDLNDDHLSL